MNKNPVPSPNPTQSIADGLRTRKTLLTVPEVATLIGVKAATVYRYASQGRVPSTNIMGCVRFDPIRIADYLCEHMS